MFRRRRTAKQRQEHRIEQAEYVRRVRSGDPLAEALRNTNVTTPDPDAVKAQRERDAAIRELARTSEDPAPDRERVVCERHGWMPTPRIPGAPQPPPSQCPGCRAQAGVKPEGPPVYLNGSAPQREYPISEAAEALWEQKQAEREARGEVIAGRESERRALDRIAERRAEEEERERERDERASFYRNNPDPNAIYMPRRKRQRRSSSSRLARGVWRTNGRGNIEVEA